MHINIKWKNMDSTDAIEEYVTKKVTNLEKLLSHIEEGGGEVRVNFEVNKSTNHHKNGEVFHADCLIKIDGKEFYGSADAEDIYAAIDEIREILYRDIEKKKDRAQTLYKRGASSVKKMLKGLSKRNPFTSKY